MIHTLWLKAKKPFLSAKEAAATEMGQVSNRTYDDEEGGGGGREGRKYCRITLWIETGGEEGFTKETFAGFVKILWMETGVYLTQRTDCALAPPRH